VTIDVLEQYVEALGGHVEVSVVQGRRRTSLLGRQESRRATASKPSAERKVGSPSETSRRSA
jgi:hypothetical protein